MNVNSFLYHSNIHNLLVHMFSAIRENVILYTCIYTWFEYHSCWEEEQNENLVVGGWEWKRAEAQIKKIKHRFFFLQYEVRK